MTSLKVTSITSKIISIYMYPPPFFDPECDQAIYKLKEELNYAQIQRSISAFCYLLISGCVSLHKCSAVVH